MSLSRSEWRALAQMRLEESRSLLAVGLHSGAYHLCGLAVKCALKACIAKQFKASRWPERKLVMDAYVHDLASLAKVGRLSQPLAAECAVSQEFDKRWSLVQTWSIDSRYENWSSQEAADLYEAVSHARHGVLRWIGRHW